MERFDKMVLAQIDNASGISYLVARDRSTGKFVELDEQTTKDIIAGKRDDLAMIEVWEKPPNVQAFIDLMNRTIDKPSEQVQVDAKHSGGLVMRWEQ